MKSSDQTIESYVKFFETLSPETLPELAALCSEDLRFCDPFNDVRGIEQTMQVFLHMFANTQNPVFRVYEWQRSDQVVFLFWNFRCRSFGRPLDFDGVSRVLINDANLISEHVDYWDSGEAFWQKIPLLGSVIKLLSQRISAGNDKL